MGMIFILFFFLLIVDLNFEAKKLDFFMFLCWLLTMASRRKESIDWLSLSFLLIPCVGCNTPS